MINPSDEEISKIREDLFKALESISKLITKGKLINRDIFFLKDVRTDLKTLNERLRAKTFPVLTEREITKINKYAEIPSLSLLSER